MVESIESLSPVAETQPMLQPRRTRLAVGPSSCCSFGPECPSPHFSFLPGNHMPPSSPSPGALSSLRPLWFSSKTRFPCHFSALVPLRPCLLLCSTSLISPGTVSSLRTGLGPSLLYHPHLVQDLAHSRCSVQGPGRAKGRLSRNPGVAGEILGTRQGSVN